MSYFVTRLYSVFLIGVLCAGLFLSFGSVNAQVQFDPNDFTLEDFQAVNSFTFPVPSLGGCQNLSDCQRYCTYSQKRYDRCVSYLNTSGLISDEQANELGESSSNFPNIPDEEVTSFSSDDPSEPEISVADPNVVGGVYPIYVSVSNAEKVRLYLLSNGVLTPFFLGEMTRTANNEWVLFWDSRQYANGTYTIQAQAEGNDVVRSSEFMVTVVNVVESVQTTLQDAARSTVNTEPTNDTVQTTAASAGEVIRSYVTTTNEEPVDNESTDEVVDSFERLLEIQRERLLGVTLAGDDPDPSNEDEEIRRVVATLDVSEGEREQLIAELEQIVSTFKEEIVTFARSAKDGINPAVLRDSDNDGVLDFYEINVYGTDPLSSDSDNDGQTDRVEILGGFDPRDSESFDRISYGDVKTTGATVENIFFIDSAEVVETRVGEDGKEIVSKITFRGRALPNSFVTLFIFSSPIVVTVETDENGIWEYTLNQELEDGTHEIYAAIVDNSGKILAKGSPVPFVQEASAIELGALDISLGGDSAPSALNPAIIISIVVGLVVVFALALVIVGHSHKKHEEEHAQGVIVGEGNSQDQNQTEEGTNA